MKANKIQSRVKDKALYLQHPFLLKMEVNYSTYVVLKYLKYKGLFYKLLFSLDVNQKTLYQNS